MLTAITNIYTLRCLAQFENILAPGSYKLHGSLLQCAADAFHVQPRSPRKEAFLLSQAGLRRCKRNRHLMSFRNCWCVCPSPSRKWAGFLSLAGVSGSHQEVGVTEAERIQMRAYLQESHRSLTPYTVLASGAPWLPDPQVGPLWIACPPLPAAMCLFASKLAE